MSVRKGDLVVVPELDHEPALVISHVYCTVFTTKDLNSLSDIDPGFMNRTLLSSEVLVVDVLLKNQVYKKIPVATLAKER